MYHLLFYDGVNPPIVTKTKFNEADALWWADQLRELQNKFSVNIVYETTDLIEARNFQRLLENLPQTTGPRIERPGAEYGIGVEI